MSENLFLTDEQLRQLTGRKQKSRQIAWLRNEGIPFRVNATGHAVVARGFIDGRKEIQEKTPRRWTPRVVGAH